MSGDVYLTPRISKDFGSLAKSKWLITVNLKIADNQIQMRENDKKKSAFGTPRSGLYQN